MLKWVKKEVSSKDLEELMTVKDIEGDVSFYVKDGSSENHVEKLLMFVTQHSEGSLNKLEINGRDIESVLLLLEGDIDLYKISKLTDQMDLPGGKQLKKAQQKQSL